MYKRECLDYIKAGLSPIPIRLGMKRPVMTKWQEYCHRQPTKEEISEWCDKHPDQNIGLAMGTKVGDGLFLIAVDIDNEEVMPDMLPALGNYPCAKKGKKGLTIFMLADKSITNKKVKHKKSKKPTIEFLCSGSQTVIPPSIHPDKMEYVWIGEDLLSSIDRLPVLNVDMVDEIVAICESKGGPFLDLNEMIWAGVDGGGDTHDVSVRAVALAVSRGWLDPHIHTRVERAKREACLRAGEVYKWPQSTKIIQGWIDSARAKGMTDSSKPKSIPPERKMANWALEELGTMTKIATIKGQMRSYEEGYWPVVNVPNIMRRMYMHSLTLKEREAKSAISIMHTLTEKIIFGYTPGVDPKEDQMRHRICLMNGTINIKTGELEQWDIDHELSHRLEFDWEDEATCPLYEEVIKQTLDGDEKAIALFDEYCGLSLIDDMSFQKVLFLKGPGGNGKGTLARVLRDMHNPNSVSSVAITDLNDERKRTSLVGKLINISGEQSRLNLVSDTYLKKITGGDPIDIRKLYGETQNNIMLSVRFLELVNEMPSTSDHSHALKRRIIILECPNKVNKPDFDLDKKLHKERAGILRRWVAALKRLYDRGDFDIPEKSLESVEQYMLENNPVAYWVKDVLEECEEDEKGTASRILYSHYRDWSMAMGFKSPYSEIFWGKKMVGLGYNPISKRFGHKVIRCRLLKVKDGHEF